MKKLSFALFGTIFRIEEPTLQNFYGCNLRIFVKKALVLVPVKPFQPSITFVAYPRVEHLKGAVFG
jgi:hypothetical protein